MKRTVCLCIASAVLCSWTSANAKPPAPGVFCERYPSAQVCQGAAPACTYCHTTPPAKNPFGRQVEAVLLPGAPRPLSDSDFSTALGLALSEVEVLDADGDGQQNIAEILAGTYPGDASSLPAEVISGCPSREQNGWDVCAYDPIYVYKKLHLDFCGKSPTQDRLRALEIIEDQREEITLAMERCLTSEYWRGKDGALWRIANRKIRPTQAIKSGDNQGAIPLADYEDDYNLFVYTQIDDHDARDVLRARYLVQRSSTTPTTYTRYEANPFQDLSARGVCVAQVVEVNRRAGLLTTRWNLMFHTMFTPLPRTTAAQAYRAYLGLDIARMEGLVEVPGEPVDYDQKGVTAPACRQCHSTLDPLSYPFSRYAGFTGGALGIPFTYNTNRISALSNPGGDNPPPPESDTLVQTPEAGVLFGEPVRDLLEWGSVAAESDEFAKATVLDYWRLIFGEPPRPTETEEFTALWRNFKTLHRYSVERMLQELIQMEAYGVP